MPSPPKLRITLTTLLTLRVLLDGDPGREMYGLEICKASKLPSGTVHPILARLESAGWLVSTWETLDRHEAGRPPRRYYRLTDEGRAAAGAALSDARTLLDIMKEKP